MPRPQPALAVLRMRRISNRQAARSLGYNAHWFGRVLNGHKPPSPKLRRKLAAFLDLPEASLFHDDPPERGAA
jgi:hypothetical protein